MKKMMITLMAMFTIVTNAVAMSFEQAREQALFLTDKMAYELNLTDEQYEAAYEINLDYLMGVTSYDDVYGTYWERRNLDLSYILLDWQWKAFCAASYFYRPLYWDGGYWHFGIYARYPQRTLFYFGRPAFYVTYNGGHSWHVHGGLGYYHGHRHHYRPVAHHTYRGMRDHFDNRRHIGNRTYGNHHGGNHTYGNNHLGNNAHGNNHFGKRNYGNHNDHTYGGTTSPRTDNRGTTPSAITTTNHTTSNFGSARSAGNFNSARSTSRFAARGSVNSARVSTRSMGAFNTGGARSVGSLSAGSSTRATGSFGSARSSGTLSSARSGVTLSNARGTGSFGGAHK